MPLRIVFMGTPELAALSLDALLRAPEFQVAAVVTQPDHPKGRGLKLQPPPVKELALRNNLAVLQPQRARDEAFLVQLRELAPELIVVAAYGHILPQTILDLPRFGCLNVHTSLLPKYRGAAPIQWALLNGDAETGVTIMKMDAGMDTGEIVSQERTAIRAEDDSPALHHRLGRMGAELLVKTIPDYVSGRIVPRRQPAGDPILARKIKKEDGRIDWHQPATAIRNRVRALDPWPGAFTHFAEQPHPILKIREAEVVAEAGAAGEVLRANRDGIVVGSGSEALRITRLQREGGREMTAQEFLAGHPLQAGQTFA